MIVFLSIDFMFMLKDRTTKSLCVSTCIALLLKCFPLNAMQLYVIIDMGCTIRLNSHDIGLQESLILVMEIHNHCVTITHGIMNLLSQVQMNQKLTGSS